MRTFTKTLIASAMAVAVAGPVSANPNFAGVYAGSKTDIKVNPSGCPNGSLKNQSTAVGFAPAVYDFVDFGVDIPFSGCWALTNLGGIIDEDIDRLQGIYIERKVGKDLTMAFTLDTVEDVVDVMNLHLVTESKCDVSAIIPGQGVDPLSVTVQKANGKLSKNGERLNLNIDIRGKYDSSSKDDRNIKATIKGKMDFNPTGLDPLLACDELFEDFFFVNPQ